MHTHSFRIWSDTRGMLIQVSQFVVWKPSLAGAWGAGILNDRAYCRWKKNSDRCFPGVVQQQAASNQAEREEVSGNHR